MPATAYLSVVENYFAPPASYSAPQKRFAVTDKQVIARLAALINTLPPGQGKAVVITPCPSSLAPAYELDFGASSGAKPVAEVSIECFGVMVTLNGQSKPILSMASVGRDQFLREVGTALGGSAN